MSHGWLSLATVEALVPEAARRGVSKVARGETRSGQTREGFVQAYRATGGSSSAMARRQATSNTSWAERRQGFISRHVAQGGPWWETVGGVERPTRRHLGLVMWAYSPTPAKLKAYASKAKKNPGGRMARRNPSLSSLTDTSDAIADFLLHARPDLPPRAVMFLQMAEVPDDALDDPDDLLFQLVDVGRLADLLQVFFFEAAETAFSDEQAIDRLYGITMKLADVIDNAADLGPDGLDQFYAAVVG